MELIKCAAAITARGGRLMYIAIRKSPDGYEFADLRTISHSFNRARSYAEKEDKSMPYYADINPVIRFEPVRIVSAVTNKAIRT